jgi:formate dehydrogenase major subunit
MGKKEEAGGRMELSRRDFLKVAGAGAAAVAVMEPLMAAPAAALKLDPADTTGTTTFITTCPYCSAQCGQRVVVGNETSKVYDIYGDVESPTNNGGLCAKGAGSFQLVNNARRLGVPEHTPLVDGEDFTGEAWKRVGNAAWTPITLATAFLEIAQGDGGGINTGLKYLRNNGATMSPGDNPKGVMFFGSSHMNNECNNIYRKIIANFGTSNVEHQARI